MTNLRLQLHVLQFHTVNSRSEVHNDELCMHVWADTRTSALLQAAADGLHSALGLRGCHSTGCVLRTSVMT